MSRAFTLGDLSTHQVTMLLHEAKTSVVLLPIGSTEPHGPHLPLSTDVILAAENASRASHQFPEDWCVFVAPPLPYGVTDFAAGFKGAIGISTDTFKRMLRDIVSRFVDDGFDHVCIINHHLDPNHLTAMDEALELLWSELGKHRVSQPSVLERRWGRQLGDEFRSGACHAGEYEGSMVLAAQPNLFQREAADELPALALSLSTGIQEGIQTFKELGMHESYTGNPAGSTADFGNELYAVMCDMVVTTVTEQLRSQP